MLRIRGLVRTGLAPFDLDLDAHEAVALSGASGAGKTLLLRAIADLDLNQGEIELDGQARDAMEAPAWRQLVSYLAAEPGWWADRVGDHFLEPDASLDVLAQLLLPPDAMGWEVARLSTGEKQRLALARMLERSPRVLLLDEPTASLDSDATQAVEAILRTRLGQGAAMLFVTHDRDQARRIAERVLIMDAGAIRAGTGNGGDGPAGGTP